MLLGILVALPSFAFAQTPPKPPPSNPPGAAATQPPEETARQVLQRAERLALARQTDAAIRLLQDWRARQGRNPRVTLRLARFLRDTGRWKELEELADEELKDLTGAEETALLRLLAEARFELGHRDEAIAQLRAILKAHPGEISYARMVASTLSRHEETAEAIGVLLQARETSGDPGVFAQQLGALYAKEDRVADAATEFLRVIQQTPRNYSLMRSRILDLIADHPPRREEVMEVVEKAATAGRKTARLQLLLGELRQRSGDDSGAWELVSPLIADPAMVMELFQVARAMLAESRLPDADPVESRRSLRLGQRILSGLIEGATLPKNLQGKAYDTLSRIWLALLENPSFPELPTPARREVLEGARQSILDMARLFPHDHRVTAALLRLGRSYVDLLHEPRSAIALFERIQVDPNASEVEIHAARVELGRAFMAAGDTTRARSLFETMGKDMSFVEGQGRAHYHLGQLDLMGGHFQRAKERFSAVAFESPSAGYTNDALDLALLLAEELMGKSDREGLSHYGRALYFRITAQEDSMRNELHAVARSNSPVLRARALFELAKNDADHGRDAAALRQIDLLVKEAPRSRPLVAALELKGDLLLRTGRPRAAFAAWEKLLNDHYDYVFLDRVRTKMRALKDAEPATGTDGKELP